MSLRVKARVLTMARMVLCDLVFHHLPKLISDCSLLLGLSASAAFLSALSLFNVPHLLLASRPLPWSFPQSGELSPDNPHGSFPKSCPGFRSDADFS